MVAAESPPPVPIPLPAFASSDAEAQQRFEQTRSTDPFPDIPPALLNSADLQEYIAATGMLYPFRVDPEDPTEILKPASCGIRLAGRVVYWQDGVDGDAVKVSRELAPGEELELRRNSIVFVTLEPMLRMPDYIAARFNLTIRDIYRGLLVGTGPLVDPSFVGRISIPLHNLTYNNYTIKQGEPIAWMEFTKISPNERWAPQPPVRRTAVYVPFPKRKRRERETVEDYLRYAANGPITSSIPRLVGAAQASAADSAKAAKRISSVFAGISVVGLIAIVVGVVAIVISVYSLVDASNASRTDLARSVAALEHEVKVLRAADATPRSR
jgi:deoxycytidine triphosphate deaminase